jgi:hypothetical protein
MNILGKILRVVAPELIDAGARALERRAEKRAAREAEKDAQP